MASIVYQFDDSNITTANTNQIYAGGDTTDKTVAYYARKYCTRTVSGSLVRVYCNPEWVLIVPGTNSQVVVTLPNAPAGPGHVVITLDTITPFAGCDSCSNPGDQQCYEFMKVCKNGTTFTPPGNGTSVPISMGLQTCETPKSCSLLSGITGIVNT